MIKSSARAPAKLIISGEHSVLYGQAAIAMAVNRYTTTTTTWHNTPHIHFKLIDLAYAKSHTFAALRRLKKQLQQDYSAFLTGKCSIGDVLKRPFELLQYSVSKLIEHLNLKLPHGVEIAVDSSIPLGCGMGSSAAAIISTLCALAHFLKLDWQPADFLSFGREIENLQHGNSSGLDLHLVTYGGCVKFKDGKTQARAVPTIPLQIVNTGKPEVSTGECVTTVATVMSKNSSLIAEFGSVTAAVDQALTTNNVLDFRTAIKANHQLLQAANVVPLKVANFINAIEQYGAAAKICGAGASAGETAGIVLLSADQDLQHVADKFGYQIQNIQVDLHGTQII